jgi:hypothetical protein
VANLLDALLGILATGAAITTIYAALLAWSV